MPVQLMSNIHGAAHAPSESLEAELQTIQAESIGWTPLGEGAYLHLGNPDEDELIIQVVGTPDAQMAGMNVLLLGW